MRTISALQSGTSILPRKEASVEVAGFNMRDQHLSKQPVVEKDWSAETGAQMSTRETEARRAFRCAPKRIVLILRTR